MTTAERPPVPGEDVDEELVAALRAVPLLAALPDEAVRHYAARGDALHVAGGGHFAEQGDEQAWFFLLLAGRVEWTRHVAGVDVHVLTHSGGMFFGHEPILLDIAVPVTGTALEPSWAFRFRTEAFWELLASCPEIRRELLSTVTQRAQTLEVVSQHQAKLVALGTLSAGLAHELNNPAAAVRAAVEPLGAALADVSATALRLGRAVAAAGTGRDAAAADAVLDHLDQLRRGSPTAVAPGAVQRADAEDAVADWLEERGVEDAWERAPALVRGGVDVARLDELAAVLPDGVLDDAVAWLTAALEGADVLAQVREGAGRISSLVQAMREYTYLDRGERQHVDVHEGLESTLTILGHRMRGGIEVVRDYGPDLPPVDVRGSELNQVWTNLIANAVDAMDTAGGGRLTLTTRVEGSRVVVDVADTGPGVPEELRERVFEPYFTTKAVGQGTGMGLDITRRIVASYGGDLRVDSRPGSTHFTVRLPGSAGEGADAQVEPG